MEIEEKKQIVMNDLFRVAKSHKAKRSEKLQAARLWLAALRNHEQRRKIKRRNLKSF